MAVKQKNGYGWGKEEKTDLENNKCRNEMCEVHQKDSKWTEYLDFGPHGLSVIRNAGAHKVRVSIHIATHVVGRIATHMIASSGESIDIKIYKKRNQLRPLSILVPDSLKSRVRGTVRERDKNLSF